MESEQDSYEWDKKVLVKVYSEDILNYEPIYQLLEEESIYWNDDVDFVISMIIKTLKSFKAHDGEDARLMPMFKNEEDRDFVKNLYRKAILKSDDNLKLISEYTKNWDVDRIAFMDILLMQTALAEIIEFPSIPVKVTLNEYIEISKFYSTNKSSTFINGILDKIVNKLRSENKIQKLGRGLIGEFK
jgi:N utilization substance protein B